MSTFRATAPGPWGPTGSEFRRETPGPREDWYLGNGTLVEIKTEADMTPKERAIARAEALGLDTSGKQSEIEKRIAEHEAPPTAPDNDEG